MTTGDVPGWWFDEFSQVGTDFGDPNEAAQYARRRPLEDEEALLDRLGVGRGTVVVDVGCGPGSLALAAASRGARAHAVDVSPAMLALVEKANRDADSPKLVLHRAGFLGYDAEPGSVDVYAARFALHHLPDFWKQVALCRAFEVLKPGGRLYLQDVVFSFEPRDAQTAIEAWIEGLCAQSGFEREDCETHVREEYSTFAWILEGILERAGFVIEEAERMLGAYATYLCRRP